PHYENVPFEVPGSWVWTTLEEICLFLSRGKSPKYSDRDKIYPVFAQKCNLKEGGISLEQARFLDPSTICKWSEEYKLKTGDVLVNSTGTGTVGRTRLFHKSFLKDYPFVVPDSHVSVIRTISEIKSEFVFAYISSQLIQQYLEDNLAGSTNQKELYIGVLSNLSFPIPPIVEQQRIVAEIEKWFALIDQIEHDKADLQTTIKQTKSKILNLAIHGKLLPQDSNDEPASELLKRINPKAEITTDNGYYPQLPQGWCLSTLGEIGKWQSGATPSRLQKEYYGGNIPWLKTGDLNDGFITNIPEYITERALDETSVKLNPAGSVLMAMYGATIGKIGILTYPATTNQACCVCTDYHIEQMFLFYFLLANRKYFITLGGGGAQPNISKEKIVTTLLPLPPLREQQRIVARIKELFTNLDKIMENL
ncbi:restriction endonuclease subunit S, partial [Parabacteroides pacaensis]|uniref:restriction endonuclease subunit S n=1 Tax=Parabacteroides pacaensis TaxID=2086575 RepID=UPI001F352618